MSSAYGSSVVKPTPLKNVSELLPMQYTTKDNNCVTVNMVDRTNETELLVIHEMLNHEIRQGTQITYMLTRHQETLIHRNMNLIDRDSKTIS